MILMTDVSQEYACIAGFWCLQYEAVANIKAKLSMMM